MPLRLEQRSHRAWAVTYLAAKRFLRIDGTHWAESFAFNAFFSLFPLIILFVTLASFFVDRESAGLAIVTYVEGYVPLEGGVRARILGAVTGVIQAREGAGLVALLILVWVALQCFTTLVSVTNRAWGDEADSWWRLPLRGMALLGVTAGAVLLGMAAPALARFGKSWLFPANDFGSWVYALWGFVVPLLVLFLSLTLFYRLAPRRRTRFAEVWVAAACVTVLLQTTESLFVVYVKHFATLNAVYGVFGGIMALLLWIYLSGCGFVFGACLCAAQAEGRSAPAATAIALDRIDAYWHAANHLREGPDVHASIARWENEGGVPRPVHSSIERDPMKKLIVFDLDGTLAESKASLDAEMATLLGALLRVVKVAVISGGGWPQFETQLLSQLSHDERLRNLSLLPTCGTQFFQYASGWTRLYAENFSDEEKEQIVHSLKEAIESSDFRIETTWGEQIEDRGSQMTFSALGQQAPIEEKEKWDPDFAKRKKMQARLEQLIPGFSVRLGGTTSVDVTKLGIDKGYGMRKLRDTLGIGLHEMLFVGDALFPGGNDYPAKETGVESIQVRDPNESKRVIEAILACAGRVRRTKNG